MTTAVVTAPRVSTLPLEAVVRARLAEIDDPEIPGLPITELGIVRDVRVGPNRIQVQLLPTFVGCPALDVLRDAVEDGLADLAPEVTVEFTFAEPWTARRITPLGRERLRERGFAPPIRGSDVPEEESASSARALSVLPIAECPYCGSRRATLDNAFGPTLCRAIYYCADCRQPFEQFKSV